jgi:hypothetical protein
MVMKTKEELQDEYRIARLAIRDYMRMTNEEQIKYKSEYIRLDFNKNYIFKQLSDIYDIPVGDIEDIEEESDSITEDEATICAERAGELIGEDICTLDTPEECCPDIELQDEPMDSAIEITEDEFKDMLKFLKAEWYGDMYNGYPRGMLRRLSRAI